VIKQALCDPASHVAQANESEFYLVCRKSFHIALEASVASEQEQVRCHTASACLNRALVLFRPQMSKLRHQYRRLVVGDTREGRAVELRRPFACGHCVSPWDI
jgi:hypothetical protein